jgi:hypothetical protein
MPEGIQVRGPHQYRAQIRRNGVYQSKTFETLKEARQWRRVTDGKVSGGEIAWRVAPRRDRHRDRDLHPAGRTCDADLGPGQARR